MGILLTLAYLFYIGSVFGWFLELLFRNIVHKSTTWINPRLLHRAISAHLRVWTVYPLSAGQSGKSEFDFQSFVE